MKDCQHETRPRGQTARGRGLNGNEAEASSFEAEAEASSFEAEAEATFFGLEAEALTRT